MPARRRDAVQDIAHGLRCSRPRSIAPDVHRDRPLGTGEAQADFDHAPRQAGPLARRDVERAQRGVTFNVHA